jgi:hypothetical protein
MIVNWPKSLVREVADRRAVFFVGAGISRAATTGAANFPTWTELLSQLKGKINKKADRELVSKLYGKGQLLDAAQIIQDGIPAADFSTTIRGALQPRPIPISPIYQDILAMDPKTIITTNYDELIEKNFEHYNRSTEAHNVCRYNQSHILEDLRSPTRSIIKIHGCVTEPQEIVLSRSSYFKAKLKHPSFFHTVSSLMTVNTVIFLGYSVSDPDIQLILENIQLFSKSNHPHYALMNKFSHSSMKNALKESYNIHFLEHQRDRYDLVPLAISELKDDVLRERVARGIS